MIKGSLQLTRILAAMVMQEVSTRWSGGILTWTWALIQPFAQIGLYALIFGAVMVPAVPGHQSGANYVVYLCVGYFCWVGFSEALTVGAASLRGATSVLRSRPLPLALFPLKAVGAAWLVSSVGFLAILALAPFLGVALSWHWLLLPIPWLGLVALSVGGALVLAPMTVLARDMEQVIRLALPLLFWLTPIVYVPTLLPEWARPALQFNPLNFPLSIIHDLLFSHRMPDGSTWGFMAGAAAIALGLGAFTIHRFDGEVRDAL